MTRRILLGVSGGIAAYKACELTRLLVKAGCSVQVVMSEAATRFVAPLTFQALSGRAVALDLWQPQAADGMDHIARFIAGASSVGSASRASSRLPSRSSPWPCAARASRSAVAGATTKASAPRARSM